MTLWHDLIFVKTYTEKPGHNFVLNTSFDGIDPADYVGLVIPGGRAPEYLALDPKVRELVAYFVTQGKPIASICHGQQILAAVSGALSGKKCIAYPAVKPTCIRAGAEWIDVGDSWPKSAITDGKLVTAAAWPGV